MALVPGQSSHHVQELDPVVECAEVATARLAPLVLKQRWPGWATSLMMKRLLLGLMILLTSCTLGTPAALHLAKAQPQIAYRVAPLPPGIAGRAQVLGSFCLVTIAPASVSAFNIAHEVGHCLDGGRSAHFGQAGCVFRHYGCDPAEGFADTYALLYLVRYGPRLDVLGWPGAGATKLPLPNPDDVTPDQPAQLLKQLGRTFSGQP